MNAAAQPVPQGPPPGVTLGPPIPQPPPGVTLGAAIPAAPQAAAPAIQTPPPVATPPVPVGPKPTIWQTVKSNVSDELQHGFATGPIIGFVKGAAKTAAGLVTLAQPFGDNTIDVAHYRREHPDASLDEAWDAVQGKPSLSSLVTGQQPTPYRAPQPVRDHDAVQQSVNWFRSHSDPEGLFQHLGEVGENIAELLGTDGLASLSIAGDGVKAAGIAEKMTAAANTAKVLGNNPKIAKLVALGLHAAHAAVRAGAEGGLQTLVKTGGDTDAAAVGAGLGAAGGAVLEPVMAGAGAVIRKIAAPSTTVTGVEDAARGAVTDRLAETNATRVTPTNALPQSTGEYQFRIKGDAPQETTEGDLLQDARKRQTGTRVVAGKGSATAPTEPIHVSAFTHPGVGDEAPLAQVSDLGEQPAGSHKEPIYEYQSSTKPGSPAPRADIARGAGELITTDRNVAAAHLKTLMDTIGSPEFKSLPADQQAGVKAAKDDIQKQLAEYYQHYKAQGLSASFYTTPTTNPYGSNFNPIDINHAIESTSNFADAADQFHGAAREVYQHANNVTGGQWQALDGHITDLYDKLGKEPFQPGRDAIRQEIGKAKDEMSGILEDPRNGFDKTDVDQAKKNFRAGYVLQDLHQAVKPLYGVEEQTGLTTGQYRGFNGNHLGARFEEFLTKNPDAPNIIGRERVENLRRIFKANGTMAARKRFGNAVASVATALTGYHLGGWQGGLGAETAYHGIRYVVGNMVSNPKIAKNVLFAIDSGANPQNFAPMIAGMIARNATKVGVPLAASAVARATAEPRQEEPASLPAPEKAPEPKATFEVPPHKLYMATPMAKGLLKPGNINIMDRPIVPNEAEGKGVSSTVFSTGIEVDGQHILIPRVSDGADGKPPHIMSPHEALEYYKKTKQHLGIFDSDDAADAYGRGPLHEQQATLRNANGRTAK